MDSQNLFLSVMNSEKLDRIVDLTKSCRAGTWEVLTNTPPVLPAEVRELFRTVQMDTVNKFEIWSFQSPLTYNELALVVSTYELELISLIKENGTRIYSWLT